MRTTPLTPELYDYLLETSLREHPVLKALREETAGYQLAHMQIAPDEAQFLQFLLRLMRATYVLELGTFRGYSALAMALALPEEGRIITCDTNPEWTRKAPLYWQQAKQAHKIQLRLAPAMETMLSLIKEGEAGQFDFIFIDADKSNYPNYYELALKLIKPQGMIAIDNAFWDAKVIDPSETRAQTREIRRLNDIIKNDSRVFVSLLPIADGLFLIQPCDAVEELL